MSTFSIEEEIDSIQDRVDQIELLINDRIPRQYQRALEKVYAAQWLLQTLWKATTNDCVAKLKKWKLEVGLFRFQCAEAVERLTRCLFELDNILSEGNPGIRDLRKLQVVRIQGILNGFEPMKHKSESIFRQCQMWMAIADEPPSDLHSPSDGLHSLVEVETGLLQPELGSVIPEQETDCSQLEDQEINEPDVDSKMTMKEPEQEQDQLPIPHWKPHTQWINRGNSLHLHIDLPGVTEDQVKVTVNVDQGTIRISGTKHPTMGLKHHQALPSYGYFDIQKKLRTNLVVMSQCRMEWHSGTSNWLELIIPRRSSFHNRHQYRTNYRHHPWYGLVW